MTQKLDFSDAFRELIPRLQEDVKRNIRGMSIDNLPHVILANEMNKSSYGVFKNFQQQIGSEARKEIDPRLEKIGQKIAFSDRMIQYLQQGAKGLDPRAQRVLEKIEKLRPGIQTTPKNQIEKIQRKLQKHSDILGDLKYRTPDVQTTKQCDALSKEIGKLNVELLKIEPQRNEIRFRNEDLGYGLDKLALSTDRKAIELLAETGIAVSYFETAFNDNGGYRFYNLFNDGYRKIAEKLINKTEQPKVLPNSIAINDLLNDVYSPIGLVIFPPSFVSKHKDIDKHGMQFDPSKGKEEVKKQLQLLQELQLATKLPQIAATFTIGNHQIPVAILENGQINVLSIAPDETTQKEQSNPYEMIFGSIDQASAFISDLIGKKTTANQALVGTQVQVTPICRKRDLMMDAYKEQDPFLDFDAFENFSFPPKNIGFQPMNAYHFAPQRERTFESEMPPGLVQIVNTLSLKSDEGFFQSFEGMSQLNESNAKCMFRMTDETERSIHDRIFFHVYHIHDKEEPKKVDRNDLNYGVNAFQDERTTHDQKLRAAQRTLLEVSLFMLIRSLESSDQGFNVDNEEIALVLNGLEKMHLDPKDLPQGQKNIAHALFSKLYNLYKPEAEKTNSGLEHPHSGKFKGDFGRHAFCGTAEVKIPNKFKVQALKEVTEELKASWKI